MTPACQFCNNLHKVRKPAMLPAVADTEHTANALAPEVKSERLTVRLTPRELAEFKAAAKASGEPQVSEALRTAVADYVAGAPVYGG